MTFIQFHLFCGMLWSFERRRYIMWQYWSGVRGYPGQRDVAIAFEEAKIAWVLKARQLGLSEEAAEYAFYVAVTEPKSEIIIISKQLNDAKYFLKKRFLPKVQAAYALELAPGKRFPWPRCVDNSDTGKILFDNGSWVEAVSSDNSQVRSRTPRLVIFDEVREFSPKDAVELMSAILPAIQNNAAAQLICISTAKYASWWNEETKEIMAGRRPDYTFLFIPADTNPDRTPTWFVNERKNWSSLSLFSQEYPIRPEDCFVAREGAVFPAFDPNPPKEVDGKEVGGRHVHDFEPSWAHQYIIGYDHGRQHPAVLLLCVYSRHDNHLYVFDELFCRGMELPDIAYAIRLKMNYWKDKFGAPPPQVRLADSACFAKDGRRTVAEMLRELAGIHFRAAIKHDILTRLDRLNVRFSQNLITIHPRCVETRRQIQYLRWKHDPTESKKEMPEDIEDDAVDVLGYIDSELNASVKKTPKPREELFSPQRKAELEKVRRHLYEASPTIGGENPNAWQAG